MKRILTLILAFCMIFAFAACGEKNDTPDTTEKPSDYGPDGKLIFVDPEKPLVDVESKEYRDIYEEDGKAHDNSYRVPKLDVNLEGANEVSDAIYSDFKNNYGTHFSMLDDLSGEKVRPGEPYITVDYDFEYHLDILVTIVHGVSTAIDGTVTNTYNMYYYDALADVELMLDDYLAYCQSSYNDVAGAALEALKVSHPEETEIDAHSLAYAIRTDAGDTLKFDAYVVLSTGDTVIVPVEVEKVSIDMSQFEVQ